MLSSCAADLVSFFDQIYERIYNKHCHTNKFTKINRVFRRNRQPTRSANTTGLPVGQIQSSSRLDLGRPPEIRLSIEAETRGRRLSDVEDGHRSMRRSSGSMEDGDALVRVAPVNHSGLWTASVWRSSRIQLITAAFDRSSSLSSRPGRPTLLRLCDEFQ